MDKKPSREDYKRYLEDNVNIIVKPLMVELLKKRPEGVVDFMLDWCSTKGREIEGGKTNNKENNSQEQKKEKQTYDRSHLPLSETEDSGKKISWMIRSWRRS